MEKNSVGLFAVYSLVEHFLGVRVLLGKFYCCLGGVSAEAIHTGWLASVEGEGGGA